MSEKWRQQRRSLIKRKVRWVEVKSSFYCEKAKWRGLLYSFPIRYLPKNSCQSYLFLFNTSDVDGKKQENEGKVRIEMRSDGWKRSEKAGSADIFGILIEGLRKHLHTNSILSISWCCSSFPGDINETRLSPDRASEWISFLFTAITVAQFQRAGWLSSSDYPASSIRVKYSYH